MAVIDRAAKKAAAVAVGLVVETVKGYRAARDFFGARREAPFR